MPRACNDSMVDLVPIVSDEQRVGRVIQTVFCADGGVRCRDRQKLSEIREIATVDAEPVTYWSNSDVRRR
jgi:hypothetical protein